MDTQATKKTMETNRQVMARHLLQHRAKGYSVTYVLRHSMWRYALLFASLVLSAVAVLSTTDSTVKGFWLWASGAFCGAFFRDIGWLRGMKRRWPFTREIIDWHKVEQIAEAHEAANHAGMF